MRVWVRRWGSHTVAILGWIHDDHEAVGHALAKPDANPRIGRTREVDEDIAGVVRDVNRKLGFRLFEEEGRCCHGRGVCLCERRPDWSTSVWSQSPEPGGRGLTSQHCAQQRNEALERLHGTTRRIKSARNQMQMLVRREGRRTAARRDGRINVGKSPVCALPPPYTRSISPSH